MDNGTIAAISTPAGRGGIAVIRVSGADAVKICNSVFRGGKPLTGVSSHTIHYGHIIDKDGSAVDEVLVSVMLAPKTFTREDVVEISTHGGHISSRRVLSVLYAAGARPAEAGEFTKRAFLNGRIDLTQAEAVIDIINAKTDLAQKNALSNAGGRVKAEIDTLRSQLVTLAAAMQVSIDYPDEDLEELSPVEITDSLSQIHSTLGRLAGSAQRGRVLRDGIKTAIIGRPNVGKSSLLNYLAMEERAIVTDIAGTTRDVIEETVDLDGVALRLMDTAGIRETEDAIERLGVERSLKFIDEAELILLVLDSENGLCDADLELLQRTENTKRIILINKTDINAPFTMDGAIGISAKTGEGMDKLSARIKDMYSLGEVGESIAITSERQLHALLRAHDALARAKAAFADGLAQDFAALDINDAISALGEIDGKTVSEDIVSAVFHDFCVGK